MGYTHYFWRPPTITNNVWDGIRQDVDKLARQYPHITVNGEEIVWGYGLRVKRNNLAAFDQGMDFIKTRGRQPDDMLTVAIAAILKTRLGSEFNWERDCWDGTQPPVHLGLDLFHAVFPTAQVPNWI